MYSRLFEGLRVLANSECRGNWHRVHRPIAISKLYRSFTPGVASGCINGLHVFEFTPQKDFLALSKEVVMFLHGCFLPSEQV